MTKQPTFKKEPDLYHILGVAIGASPQEVDDAYRTFIATDNRIDEVKHLAWKILRDPLYADLYAKKRSISYLYEAGFFVDTLSPEDVSALRFVPSFFSTPFHKITENIQQRSPNKIPAVLITTGGFSPIHHGHIGMMEVAKQEVEKNGYQVVGGYLSPSHDDYVSQKYGGEAELSHDHRIYLAQLAVYESSWLMIDPWESRYVPTDINFSDVLKHLEDYLTFFIGIPLTIFYVFGSDNAPFARAFTNKFGCVCVSREGIDSDRIKKEKDNAAGHDRIFFAHHTKNHEQISSTAARKWKANLMPEEVSHVYFSWRKNLLLDSAATDRPKKLYILRDEDDWAIKPWIKKCGKTRVLRAKAAFQDRLARVLRDSFLFPLSPDLPSHVEIRTYRLTEQKRYVDQLQKKERILNLDACTADKITVSASRQFNLADGQIHARQLIGRPGFSDIQTQIAAIEPGEYTLVDDDIATGSTINMLMGMLPENVRVTKIRTLTNYSRKMYNHHHLGEIDQEPFDMVDLRDFIVGSRAGGLVVQLPNMKTARAPYIEPYVSTISRACILPSSVTTLSRAVWEMNEAFFSELNDLNLNDLDEFAQHLFDYLGFEKTIPMHLICRWHREHMQG